MAGVPAWAQFYTFTSGPSGDGFEWPASPQGLLSNSDTSNFEEFSFSTPDGIDIQNYTGNNVFFDSQYQVAGNASGIDGEAVWGNPTPDDFSSLDFFTFGFESVAFDYAHATAGGSAPSSVDLTIQDSEGRATFLTFDLFDTYSGFGGFNGYEGRIEFSRDELFDDTGEFEGNEEFADIDLFFIDFSPIETFGGTSEFAIDNLSLDGSTGGGGEGVFPSFNGGAVDATGTVGSISVVRDTGVLARGIEVTNADGAPTTYTVVREPDGDFTDLNAITADFIDGNTTEFTPNVFGFDTNRPSGEYGQDIRVVNTGDPTDPDNITRQEVDVHDLPALSGNFASVVLSANQNPILANAAAVPNGFRAAIKIESVTTTGPFTNTGFTIGDSVAAGEQLDGSVEFDRFGRLSGTYNGTMTVASTMTTFSQFDRDFELFLANKQPVNDLVWNLSFTLGNRTADNASYTTGESFLSTVGINSASTAVTIVDGKASGTRDIAMNFALVSDPPEAELMVTPFDVDITGGTVDPYVLQITFEGSGPAAPFEGDLRVLMRDTLAGVWVDAAEATGQAAADVFLGSYEAFDVGDSATLAQNVGVFGVDTLNNQAWIVLDRDGRFSLGRLVATALVGDYNGNGQVEQGDLNLVLNNWGGARGDWDNAEGFLTGNVDQEELNRVLNNWGSSSASPDFSGFVVPEPSAFALLFGAVALRRRRRVVSLA
ncbi:MAG: hypothetical protein AAF328_02830 [Planctomycetota bacterium]